MKSTNTTLHIATSTTMENPTSKDVKAAKLGNMYAQVIDLRKHGYSYKKIHDILGDVSYNYCAVICLTYYAIENDDYDVFYTNKSVHNYNYIIPWAIKTLGKDEAEVKAKISEQRMKRISDDKNGLFRRAYPAPTTQVMESKNNVNVPISLVEQLNDNLTFFRKLICGGTSAFTLNG